MSKYEVGEVRDGYLFIEEGKMCNIDVSEFNEGDKLYLDSNSDGSLVAISEDDLPKVIRDGDTLIIKCV